MLDWHALLADTGWTDAGVVETAEGPVTVEEATLEGARCVRGDLSASVAASALLRTVRDLDRATRWATVAESRVLARAGETIDWVQVLDLPGWTMAADRFWLSRGRLEHEGETTIWHWERVPDGEHPDTRADVRARWPNALELTVNVGTWRFSPAADGTLVRYASCSRDDGALPAAVSAFASRRTLPELLVHLVVAARGP